MKKIDNPENYTICEFNGVDACGVYLGGFDRLLKANLFLKWRKDEELASMCECSIAVLTLKEIVDQLGNRIITVFISEPLNGTILQYGNYGDEWWEIGSFCGYA